VPMSAVGIMPSSCSSMLSIDSGQWAVRGGQFTAHLNVNVFAKPQAVLMVYSKSDIHFFSSFILHPSSLFQFFFDALQLGLELLIDNAEFGFHSAAAGSYAGVGRDFGFDMRR